jgi:hypothetical protein
MTAGSVAPDFRHGAWLVDLSATRDGVQVVEAIAAAVGIANDITDEDLTISLERMLRTRRVLLILDNFELVLEALGRARTAQDVWLLEHPRDNPIRTPRLAGARIAMPAVWSRATLTACAMGAFLMQTIAGRE